MRYETKCAIVYRDLKQKIVSGNINQGERLVISEIAKRYEMSAIPVREAIAQLERDGLVELIPHAGAKVTKQDSKTLKEILEVRIALEGLVAKLSGRNITEKEIEKLIHINEQMRICSEQNDIFEYEKLDTEFHNTIHESCPNQTLKELYVDLRNKSQFTKTVFYKMPQRMKTSYEHHLEWIKALQEKDSNELVKIANKHYKASFGLIEKVMNEREGV